MDEEKLVLYLNRLRDLIGEKKTYGQIIKTIQKEFEVKPSRTTIAKYKKQLGFMVKPNVMDPQSIHDLKLILELYNNATKYKVFLELLSNECIDAVERMETKVKEYHD